MRSPVLLAASLLLALTFGSRSATAQYAYAKTGTFTVEQKTLGTTTTRVVRPTTGGPFPLVIASHGWSASGDNQTGWAKHFASWGFVVAVPTFPNAFQPDTTVNAKIITDLVTDLGGKLAAENLVKPGVYGLEGHSAGGLATTVAGADTKNPPKAIVLFDPVDRDDVGKAAYGKICAPLLSLFAAPGSCNANAGWKAFAASAKGGVVAFDVVGSTHCDGERDGRALCGPFCGGAASSVRQDVYAHYATALFLAELAQDANAKAALAEATLKGDAKIAGLVTAKSSCGTPSTPNPNEPQDPGSRGGTGKPSGGEGAGSSGSSGGAGLGTPQEELPPSGSDPASGTDGCLVGRVFGRSNGQAGRVVFLASLAVLLAKRRRTS